MNLVKPGVTLLRNIVKSSSQERSIMPPAKVKPKGVIELVRIEDRTVTIPIIGLTPVIPHQWSVKSKNMMRTKQTSEAGSVQSKREAKAPDEEAEAAMYRLPDGSPGIPSTAFKGAMVAACRFFDGLPMTEGRLLIYVHGEGPQSLVRLHGTEIIREDTPRNATGVVDLRYRTALIVEPDAEHPDAKPWTAELTISYPHQLISANSIVALVDGAGRVGVGDWRPGSPKSNTGTFGTFRIDLDKLDESEKS
jgi:hypothetical protein